MFDLFAEEDYSYIDIVIKKYINMSLEALRVLCLKCDIPISRQEKKSDIALVVIPKALCSDDYLNNFYHALEPQEKKVLNFMVNYGGNNLQNAVKKKFEYEIVIMHKKGITTYVWWLELFVHNNEFDPTLKEYFLEFLSKDKHSHKKKSKPMHEKIKIVHTTKDIGNVVIDKVSISGESYPQELHEIEPLDATLAIRVLYALCSDKKIKITQKGTITVRSNKLLIENMPNNFNYVWLLNFFTINKYLTLEQTRTPTNKFILLASKSDADVAKVLFNDFIQSKEMYELAYAMFHVILNRGDGVKLMREMVLNIIKEEETNLWISIDYIVDKIKLDARTLKYITNDDYYTYGFYGNSNRMNFNKIEHLKVVVRYFVKAFVGIMNNFGLCSLGITQHQVFNKQDIRIIRHEEIRTYANVEFFKLSDLGRFVLGLENVFKSSNDYELILSPYNLEIKVRNRNNISDIFLQSIATKIDELKYKTDIKTFMQNIDSLTQYESIKKSFFQKCSDTPQNWRDFFMTLEERASGASVVSQNAVLIKLRNDKELLRLIASHEKLKAKILKADNLHMVVLREDLSYVKKILKEYGVAV